MIVSGASGILATIALSRKSITGLHEWQYFDVVVYGVIAFGIWKMSRVAAVAGLVLFVVEKLFVFEGNYRGPDVFVVLLLTLAFANGVRATFAYQRLLTPRASISVPAPVVPK